ncbi:MAG: GNAT family N-acetyltransferase [Candidatus Sulfotelmatobacter sp.]
MNGCVGTILRKLAASDLPAALELSEQAGWNQTADDWSMLIDLTPEGSLAIEVDGELAATTTLLCYGRRLAWIGMVLTKKSYRGRGFARRLLTQALSLADQSAIETVKLDATDQGQPLYEKMGFRSEEAVERWTRPGTGCTTATTDPVGERPSEKENWRMADHRAFGADRSELLEGLARRGQPPFVIDGSYWLTRPGRYSHYLGPSVCDGPRTARALIERALPTAGNRDCLWDLFPANADAAEIARDLAFTPTRRLQRMVRGKDLHAHNDSIYAIAGFELG